MAIGVAGAAALVVLLSSLYTVHQTQLALVVQVGQPRAVVSEPGLHMKLPWPLQNIVYVDKRVLNLDLPTEEVIAQDKKRLVVDAFARWRVTDPLRFFQSLSDVDVARVRLQPILGSNVRRVLGAQTFAAVLSGERAQLMLSIRDGVNMETKSFGIEIVDVRIRRADLPAQNSDAIYLRMQQERVREANEYRAQGEQVSQEIRSKADRDATVIMAEAQRSADITRGEGDGEKNRIFAAAFGRDPDFFSFYRSMTAYTSSLKGDNTTVILSPDSDFFRYFGSGAGTQRR
ncbi:MAG: protease modulator HflC [Alphaproteobacteria bacterium]|nr:protease modulator HflC [Alphaproteobacteria bacterium]